MLIIDIKIKFDKMKKILVLIVCLLPFCLIALCQKTVLKSSKAAVIMPSSAQKLSQVQFADYVNKNFKDSNIPLNSGNIYKINNILLSYWDWSVNSDEPKKTLEEDRSGILEGYRWFNEKNNNGYKDIEASIITINNIKFLTIKHSHGDAVYIWFYSDYKNFTRLNGIVQFTKGNEAEAAQVLNNFLKTVNIDMY